MLQNSHLKIRPRGNVQLRQALIALINQGDIQAMKEKLLQSQDDDLLMNEKYDLIRAAQEKNNHAAIIFLKRHFTLTVHLGVQMTPFGEDKTVLIGQEPLNTTGDFYHVLAYVALSKSLGYDIPRLVLTYEETQDQMTQLAYLRDAAFLEMLGMNNLLMEEDVSPAIGKLNRASSNSRRLALRERIAQGKYHLLDQKAVTAILASQYIVFGHQKISEHIRSVLRKALSPSISDNVVEHIHNFGSQELANIIIENKPVIILHLRTAGKNSDGYNEQQDLTDRFAIQLASFLEKKGYGILFVRSTSRDEHAYYYNLESGNNKKSLNPFLLSNQPRRTQFGYFFPNKLSQLCAISHQGASDPYVDIGKILHLQFFLKLHTVGVFLRDLNIKIRIVGNTSGTTDSIAFLGHDVLNIHNFKESRITSKDYQGYRILMQLTFMNVVNNEAVRVIESKVEQWLAGKHIRPEIGFSAETLSELTIGSKRSYLYDFAVLCGILGWPEGKSPNTSVEDKVSVELLAAAIPVFNYIKKRFKESFAIERSTMFDPLLFTLSLENEVSSNYLIYVASLFINIRPIKSLDILLKLSFQHENIVNYLKQHGLLLRLLKTLLNHEETFEKASDILCMLVDTEYSLESRHDNDPRQYLLNTQFYPLLGNISYEQRSKYLLNRISSGKISTLPLLSSLYQVLLYLGGKYVLETTDSPIEVGKKERWLPGSSEQERRYCDVAIDILLGFLAVNNNLVEFDEMKEEVANLLVSFSEDPSTIFFANDAVKKIRAAIVADNDQSEVTLIDSTKAKRQNESIDALSENFDKIMSLHKNQDADVSELETAISFMNMGETKDDDETRAAKKESLLLAQEEGIIGHDSIDDWILHNVDDKGNCFYEALTHQMQLLNHSLLASIPSGTVPHDSLRLRVQGANFKDKEWAGLPEILAAASKFHIVIAIVDIRHAHLGFRCYYPNENRHSEETYNPAHIPVDIPIMRLAYTGNHYLSVRLHPSLEAGAIRRGFVDPWLSMTKAITCSFWSKQFKLLHEKQCSVTASAINR